MEMGTQEFSSRSSYAYSVAEWQPDMSRYRREVEEATRTREGDPLTLVEMECSLDLIDADLAALIPDHDCSGRKGCPAALGRRTRCEA